MAKDTLLKTQLKEILSVLWKDCLDKAPQDFLSKESYALFKKHEKTLAVVIKALLFKHQPKILALARDIIQEEFKSLFEKIQQQINNLAADNDKLRTYQFIIHNMLSLYSMFEPTPEENVFVPQLIKDVENTSVELIEYKITPIELSPQKGLWRAFITDRDRLFSYGLSPVNNDNAPSLLVNLGTSWPQAQGFYLQILADLWANKTPGEMLIEWGYNNLVEWINQQQTVTSCGHSLGGSLSYLQAMAFPQKIKAAYCLNPPGIPKKKNYQDHVNFSQWYQTENKPTVRIQAQTDDYIVICGSFPEEFYFYAIGSDEHNNLPFGLKQLAAHARSFAAHKNIKTSAQQEKKSRFYQFNDRYIYGIARNLTFRLFVRPYFFIGKPIKQFIIKHKIAFIAGTFLWLGFCFFPPLTALVSTLVGTSTIAILLAGLVPSFILGQAFELACHGLNDLLFKKGKSLKNYITQFQQKNTKEKVVEALYQVGNVASLGLFYRLCTMVISIADFVDRLKNKQTTFAKIHIEKYHQKAADFNNIKLPNQHLMGLLSFATSCAYYFAKGIKFIFWQAPKKLFQLFFSCCMQKEHEANQLPTERAPLLLRQSSSPNLTTKASSIWQKPPPPTLRSAPTQFHKGMV